MGNCGNCENLINEVLFADLEVVQVPTLIVHGIHDEVVPLNLRFNTRYTKFRIGTLEFSGH